MKGKNDKNDKEDNIDEILLKIKIMKFDEEKIKNELGIDISVIKFVSEEMYGIDYIIPDYDYLVKNKKRIRGLFITHAHPENALAIFDLLKVLPDIKVYATKYTIEYLKLKGLDTNKSSVTEITSTTLRKLPTCAVGICVCVL